MKDNELSCNKVAEINSKKTIQSKKVVSGNFFGAKYAYVLTYNHVFISVNSYAAFYLPMLVLTASCFLLRYRRRLVAYQ